MLALLVWAVWPRATDGDQRAAYARLRGAPVPPLLVGGTLARAELANDGYTFLSDLPGVGRVSIVGRAGNAPSSGVTEMLEVRGHSAQVSVTADSTTIAWQEPTGAYTLTLPGRADEMKLQAVAQRVVPLREAERDAFGFGWDTLLLYLVYLPLFVGFFGWASGRLLAR